MAHNNTSTTGVYLSNTPQGKTWLTQFDESDRETARLLLDSVLYVSNEKLIVGLYDLIKDFLKHKANGPIALFAARENTGEHYWGRRINMRPLSVVGRQEVGSEGIFSNLCRDIAHSDPRILDHPSILDMRESCCRHILCIDDMMGSGTRMVSFAEWLYRNETIKSWHSLKYINFIACAYAASLIGEKCVSQCRLYSDILLMQSTGIGRAIWRKEQKEQIEKVCRTYAQYTSKPYLPIGYKDSFTCIVFAHKCPNTNPAVLYASKENSWTAFFPDRPELIIDASRLDQKQRYQERILMALGHTQLTKPSFFRNLSDESRQLLTILSCLAGRRRHEYVLGDIMELPLPIIRQQVNRCMMYRWIDTEKRLTDLGKRVLIAARRNECISTIDIEIKASFYYPLTFRNPASTSS